MITGLLAQLPDYKPLHPGLAKAIGHLLSLDFDRLDAGKYEVDGDRFFYMVNEYNTKPAQECEPERHRRYTDIQIMIRGTEKFGYAAFMNQPPSTGFLPDNDVAFYRLPADELDYITLVPGKFIIFFPTDIHQPEVNAEAPAPVKKLVAKVDLFHNNFQGA